MTTDTLRPHLPEYEDFRMEIRSWLRENMPEDLAASPYTATGYAEHLAWERKLYNAGYAAPSWPADVGGMGANAWQQLVFDEEYVSSGLPERLNKVGLIHGGPTVIAHGSDEQKARWLPGILTCDEIWCQGFSEPDAGSDLSALRTKGEIGPGSMIVNGAKIWTSHGTIADKMFALVRTDPDSQRARGISFVIIDMNSPGVEIRPLTQLHGHPGFAEVFFQDVEVPLENVVGEINDGWRIAQTSLQLERGAGRGNHTRLLGAVRHLADATAADRNGDDQAADLGMMAAWSYAFQQATYRSTELMVEQKDNSGLASTMKLTWSELQRDVYDSHMELLAENAEIAPGSEHEGAFSGVQRNYWHARASEIFAGSTEIQLNVIAERVLGLPRETRK